MKIKIVERGRSEIMNFKLLISSSVPLVPGVGKNKKTFIFLFNAPFTYINK